MQAQDYWNTVGVKKEFEDPLFLEKLKPFLPPHPKIIEYGCGYGRLTSQLMSQGYSHVTGFDFAPGMIERGKRLHPHLDLQLLLQSGQIPLPDASVDGILMLTVLCSMTFEEQQGILAEIHRILKPKGALYLSDFLLCDDPAAQKKYEVGFKEFGIFGTYRTTDGLTVHHATTAHITDLLKLFNIQWFEQIQFKTMNGNAAQTFHTVAIK